jgi:hypothetical protein
VILTKPIGLAQRSSDVNHYLSLRQDKAKNRNARALGRQQIAVTHARSARQRGRITNGPPGDRGNITSYTAAAARVSLVPQRDRRLNPRRTPRRNIRRNETARRKQQRGSTIDARIDRGCRKHEPDSRRMLAARLSRLATAIHDRKFNSLPLLASGLRFPLFASRIGAVDVQPLASHSSARTTSPAFSSWRLMCDSAAEDTRVMSCSCSRKPQAES